MFAFRKGKGPAEPQIEPLTLRSAEGTPLTIFSPEVIASYRRLITGLLYQGEIPSHIAMVGALRGEGVTYTALALGATLANDLPTRVCVVELNWWSPGMLRQLAEATTAPPKRALRRARPAPAGDEGGPLPESPGLSAVLAGKASMAQALIDTHLPNLQLLPAGDMPVEQRPSTARSAALKSFIGELAANYDHLLLDIPAVLTSSDAIALAALATHACIVVRQGITPVSMVKQTLDEVKHVGMLGVVLNQTRIHTPRFLYNLIPQE